MKLSIGQHGKRIACVSVALVAVLASSGCHRKVAEGAVTAASAAAAPDLASEPVSVPASTAGTASAASAAAPAAPRINLAGLSAGAFAVDASGTEWFRLLDDIPDSSGIQVNDNPYVLTIALASPAHLDALSFLSQPLAKVTPHHVKVEASTQGSAGPWTLAYEGEMPDAATATRQFSSDVKLPQPVPAKWLRLTLSSPPDAAPYGIGLAQFGAYGTVDTAGVQVVRRVDGLYRFPLQFGSDGFVLLKQDGAGVDGCYFESTHNGTEVGVGKVLGTISGGIEQGSVLHFTRNDLETSRSTPGMMAFSPDGKQAFAALFSGDAHAFGTVDEAGGERLGPSSLACKAADGPAPDPVASQLQSSGHVQLYGVNFDFDRATLRADALPVLDRTAAMLKAHGDWKIEVQGHTDSTGVDSHNLVLSQARAAAVADYLSHHGAVAAQLSAKGYGASRPIMPNDTETGRAQNRRVELVKSQ
ncbi:OOP family OmpA-OmpF porin [Caballeronia udeis]|uniref:OOP family OmpA-OmpF porin n=1 Tax=Caballeronia udeis TaxID=1232866 RepID=A0ABW8MDX9_9BURK